MNNEIKLSTLVRTIFFYFSMLNEIISVILVSTTSFQNAKWYLALSTISTVITSVLAWWYNNSFTPIAVEADRIIEKHKESIKYANKNTI